MFDSHITLAQALIVCLFSLLVVFLVLLATSWLIDFTAWVVQRMQRQPPAPAPAPAPTPAPDSTDRTAQAVLISAAIAACLGSERFVVRSIRRLSDSDSPWEQAGRIERTR